MHVREFRIEDAPELVALYRDAARGLGGAEYSAAQIAVWISFADDFPGFCERLQRGLSLVSMEDNAIASFGQLHPQDHVALLYTGTQFARRGHATAIYQQLEVAAIGGGATRLTTTASRLSRPLFLKQGFTIVELERNLYKGVEFERFKMEKRIGPAS
jgi:putative acetyltransferase